MRHKLDIRVGRRIRWTVVLLCLAILAPGPTSKVCGAEPTADEAQALTQKFSRLYAQGQFEEAIPVLERLLEFHLDAYGSDHPKTAAVLNNLAVLHRHVGDYDLAEALALRALNIYERTSGTNSTDYATALFNVGGLFQVMESYAKAEALYRQALQILQAPPATNYLRIAGALVNLGGVYLAQGDYARAEPFFLRALQTYEGSGLTNHADAADCLNNMANLYQRLRDYPRAERLYERSLQIREALSGPEHRDVAASLVNLASLHWAMQDYPKAEALFLRALRTYEKATGTNHPQTAACMQNLAVLYRSMNKHGKAEALYLRALVITEQTIGTNHYRYAAGLNNLAVLYRNMGEPRKALPYCKRAVAILERTVGLDSSRAIGALKTLAYLKADLSDRSAAAEAWRKARIAEEKEIARILSFTSGQERLQFQSRHHFSELIEHVGSGPDAAEVVLRNKAIVLDSLMEDQMLARASANPEVKATIDQLRTAGRRLNRLSERRVGDSGGSTSETRRSTLKALEDEIARLQKELAQQVSGAGRARRALSVTVPQVQAAIPPQSVLLEWVVYRHYLPNGEWESRYGVVVIPPTNRAVRGHASGDPAWIPIAPAKQIEDSVKRWLAATRGAGEEWIVRTLYRQLFAPIANVLPADTHTLIFSPDGELNLLSFATLLGLDDRFLAETYQVQYVSSGRDLLWKRAAPMQKELLVFTNPDFGASPSALGRAGLASTMRALDQRDYRSLSLVPLPGADKEAAFLKNMSTSWELNCEVRGGQQATEAALGAVRSPHVLHLGTHGFFLPEPEVEQNSDHETTAVLHNPMHRSGLALAGAQKTLDAWAKGETPPADNDGVVTAQEAAALDLQGTWLLVLSACDSGIGQARAGEGVLGLRRGFMMAGAQNLWMTLAPISDEATVDLMKDFYTRVLKTRNAPQAFSETQRHWLVKLRKEKSLMEAVRTAGPFVLTFQGTNH